MIEQDWERDVHLLPLTQHFPDLGIAREFRSKKIVVTKDAKHLLGVVSKNYQLLRHSDVVQWVSEAIDTPKHYAVVNVKSFDRGAKIHATFDMPWVRPFVISSGVPAHARIHVLNSYDGTWSFRLALGLFREDTRTSLWLGGNFDAIKAKHIAKIMQKKQLDTTIADLLGRLEVIPPFWKEMQQAPMSLESARDFSERHLPKKFAQQYLIAERFPMTRFQWYDEVTSFVESHTKSYSRRLEVSRAIARYAYPTSFGSRA